MNAYKEIISDFIENIFNKKETQRFASIMEIGKEITLLKQDNFYSKMIINSVTNFIENKKYSNLKDYIETEKFSSVQEI